MEHSEAIEIDKLAEAYVLGELLPEQRDAFEQHFFDCAECAADVRDAAIVLDSMRSVLRAAPKVIAFPSRATAWWARIATAAAIVSMSFLAWQNFAPRPPARIAVAENASPIELSAVRSDTQPGMSLAANAASVQRIVIPATPSAAYRIEVRRGHRVVTTGSVTAEQAKDPVSLILPALPAGEYTLAVEADGGQSIATLPLHVQ